MIDYTKDVQYIQDYMFNSSIIEYDIRAAGYSILVSSNAISDEKKNQLENMTKISRNIEIGMMIRDNPDLQQVISNGLMSARRTFIQENQLQESDIICIKKDAIFTNRKCKVLEINGITFRPKTKWRSYLRLGKIEFLVTDTNRYQILGLGDTSLEYHRDYFVKTIVEIINRVANADRSVRTYVMNFITKYKSLSLDERYYHTFKSDYKPTDAMYNYTNVIIPLMQVLSRVI